MTHGQQDQHDEPDEGMERCIADCQDCATTCNETIRHCLEMGGRHASPGHIALLLDCAAICDATAASMARASEAHRLFCAACVEVCRLCEADCRKLAADDPTMLACAEMCRQCAESCEEMVG
jgi:hypothetical protein